jgi:hypothetical protein
VKATTAIPKPGNKLRNMTRFEKTGDLRQASFFAQGSLNSDSKDIAVFRTISDSRRENNTSAQFEGESRC